MKKLMIAFALSGLVVLAGCIKIFSDSKGVLFEFKDSSKKDTFIIELFDPDKIAEARRILWKKENKMIIGTIVKDPAKYNPPWSYHLAPDTIAFAEFSMEVCDASMKYVEDHLSEVGGSFLPKNFWCPWTSRLTREIN